MLDVPSQREDPLSLDSFFNLFSEELSYMIDSLHGLSEMLPNSEISLLIAEVAISSIMVQLVEG